MKKNVLILSLLLVSAFSHEASAFGRRNHAAVAYIAEQYLTPSARKAVNAIYGGLSLAEYGCFPDDNRLNILVRLEPDEYIVVDGKPVLKGPDGKPFTYGTSFFTKEDGSVWTTVAHGWMADNDGYVLSVPKGECIWAINKYADDLRHWKDLSREESILALQMLVHEVGDMHCPSHVHYTDRRDRNDLKYEVVYRGETIRYHNIWDTQILVDRYPGGMIDMAYYCDPMINGSMSRSQARRNMKAIQEGTVEDWAHDVASCIAPVFEPQAGDTITNAQLDVFAPLGRELVLKAGYRLAALLNGIFK